MRSITAGSSIAAMIFIVPPHCPQRSTSRSNTRLSESVEANVRETDVGVLKPGMIEEVDIGLQNHSGTPTIGL